MQEDEVPEDRTMVGEEEKEDTIKKYFPILDGEDNCLATIRQYIKVENYRVLKSVFRFIGSPTTFICENSKVVLGEVHTYNDFNKTNNNSYSNMFTKKDPP